MSSDFRLERLSASWIVWDKRSPSIPVITFFPTALNGRSLRWQSEITLYFNTIVYFSQTTLPAWVPITGKVTDAINITNIRIYGRQSYHREHNKSTTMTLTADNHFEAALFIFGKLVPRLSVAPRCEPPLFRLSWQLRRSYFSPTESTLVRSSPQSCITLLIYNDSVSKQKTLIPIVAVFEWFPSILPPGSLTTASDQTPPILFQLCEYVIRRYGRYACWISVYPGVAPSKTSHLQWWSLCWYVLKIEVFFNAVL